LRSSGLHVADRSDRNKRDVRALLTSVAGISYRVIDAGLKLMIIPLATRLLGIEEYGVWLTANALLSLLMVSDFGIGSGVINAVSGALARNEVAAARSFLATAYAVFGVLAVYVATAVTLLSRSSLLPKCLGIQGHANLVLESRQLFIVMGLLISAAAFLNVINFIVSSLQEGYLAHCAQIAASVTALICILNLRTRSMSHFAVATALPIVSAYVLLTLYVFGVRHRNLLPTFTKVRVNSFKVIWKDGSRLLIAQIADTVLAFMSSVLVASHLGASHVPEVSVSLQVMMIVNYVACMFILPLWPAYVEASHRGDHGWIALAFRKGVTRSMACVGLATFMYFLIYKEFIHRWSPALPIPPRTFVFALCAWFLIYVWNKNPMVLINALGFTEVRAWVASFAAISFVTSAVLLMPHLGVVAIPVAGCISALLEACFTTTKALTLLSNHKLGSSIAEEADIAV
jgi:O-antigen/teichoic acid export membrane protein